MAKEKEAIRKRISDPLARRASSREPLAAFWLGRQSKMASEACEQPRTAELP